MYISYLGPSPTLHHKYCILLTWDLAQPFVISIVYILVLTLYKKVHKKEVMHMEA